MRKTAIAVVFASFVGVFGALQADHYMNPRSGQPQTTIPAASSTVFQTPPRLVSYEPGPSLSPAPFDFSAAAKRVSGSVVSVDQYGERQDFTGASLGEQKTGTGSGVVVSSSGLIVTNNHVVAGASKVVVRTSDHKTYTAKVLGTDLRSDLAVLKVDATLDPIETGTSSKLAAGQWVMAVGNPLGLDDTITVGVISSLGREVPIGARGMVDAIQTDASINPGNSGGALCNAEGQLIGINAAIESGTGQSIGIGFAIPVERVKTVVDSIVKYGYVKYGGIGVSYDPRLDDLLADADSRAQVEKYLDVTNLPDHGVVVVSATGFAAQAGILKNDVIQAIDGVSVDNSLDLNKATISHKPGDSVKVTVWSKGKVSTKTIVMQELPKQA